MLNFNRITFDPNVMGGKACIRGMRVTVGTVVGLVASGYTNTEILNAYPYLEEDIRQSLSYAAWRVQEIEIPLNFYELLIDMNLPPEWVNVFVDNELHVVHWRDIGDSRASDNIIMAWIRENNYVVFTRDLDFGTLLATTDVHGPSVIQVRAKDVMPQTLGNLLVRIINQHESALESGVLLTVTEDRVRLRDLLFRSEDM